MMKIFREANIQGIPAMHVVRLAVKENRLSDPLRITEQNYRDHLTHIGRGWVCEIDGRVVGFAIINKMEKNVWALFVHPDEEGMGIGKRLHSMMLNWYFDQCDETIWLTTDAGTRAELFYLENKWQPAGHYNGELKLEMSADRWKALKNNL